MQQAARREFDPRKRGPQVMGHSPQDRRPHGVALGEPQHLAPAEGQLAAFQLGFHVDRKRTQQPAVRCRHLPAKQHQPGVGVDRFCIAARQTGDAMLPPGGIPRPRHQPPEPAVSVSAVDSGRSRRRAGTFRLALPAAEHTGTGGTKNVQGLREDPVKGVLRTGGAQRKVAQRRCLRLGAGSFLGPAGRPVHHAGDGRGDPPQKRPSTGGPADH
ncbi:UNVERIFIED_ORG: hypothetical protein ABIB52_002892 [Arthrobacter sp. UYCu721]